LEIREIPDRGLALGELEALASSWLTGLFAFLHARVTSEEAVWLDQLAMLRIDFREGAGDRVADGDGLAVDSAAFDDDVQIEFVDRRDVLERSEDRVLELNRRKVFFKRAVVDGDLASAFGQPDAGDCGFAAAGGALSVGIGHGREKLD